MDENLKQELQKLIAYQKKDIEARKLNALIDRDPALIEKNKHKKAFNDAKQKIADCDRTCESIVSSFGELKKYVDDNESAFSEIENSEAASEQELEERVKKLESLKSKFQTTDKKAAELEKRAKDVCVARVDAIKSGNAARVKYTEAKDKHNELADSKAADLARINAELDSLRSSLDKDLLEQYRKLDSENKFPVIVPAAGDGRNGMYNCGGCGLNLSQQSNALLKDNGWCHCNTCGRIIVKFK